MMLERKDTIKHFMAARPRRLHKLQVTDAPFAPEDDTQDAFRITIGQRAR